MQWQIRSAINTQALMWCQELSTMRIEWGGQHTSLRILQTQEDSLRWGLVVTNSKTWSWHTMDRSFILDNHRMKKLFWSLVLMILAVILYRILWVIGFAFEVIVQAIKWPKYLAEYFRRIAVSIDQLWNVTAPTLLMIFFTTRKDKDPKKFWHEDETVSSVLWKNSENGTLSKTGKWMDRLLSRIDPWHSLNSIERDEGFF